MPHGGSLLQLNCLQRDQLQTFGIALALVCRVQGADGQSFFQLNRIQLAHAKCRLNRSPCLIESAGQSPKCFRVTLHTHGRASAVRRGEGTHSPVATGSVRGPPERPKSILSKPRLELKNRARRNVRFVEAVMKARRVIETADDFDAATLAVLLKAFDSPWSEIEPHSAGDVSATEHRARGVGE